MWDYQLSNILGKISFQFPILNDDHKRKAKFGLQPVPYVVFEKFSQKVKPSFKVRFGMSEPESFKIILSPQSKRLQTLSRQLSENCLIFLNYFLTVFSKKWSNTKTSLSVSHPQCHDKSLCICLCLCLCLLVGHAMSPHPSDHLSERSHVSLLLCPSSFVMEHKWKSKYR